MSHVGGLHWRIQVRKFLIICLSLFVTMALFVEAAGAGAVGPVGQDPEDLDLGESAVVDPWIPLRGPVVPGVVPGSVASSDAVEGPRLAGDGVAEVLESAYSRTRSVGDRQETVVYPVPVNFRDSSGDWAAIDSRLVEVAGGGWTNAANSFDVVLPDRVDKDTVRVVDGDVWVEFAFVADSPVDWDGLPELERLDPVSGRVLSGAELEASVTRGRVSGSSVTYRSVAIDTDLVYESTFGGLKETLILGSALAPSSFSFKIETSGGLGVGRIGDSLTVASTLGERFRVSPPFAEDAAGIEGPVAVSFEAGVVEYSVDEKWLTAPGRVWPVRVDPSVTVTGSGDVADCFVSEAFTSGSFCASSELKAGVDANGDERRTLIKFPNLDTVIPYLDTIYDAELRLFSHTDTGGAAIELQASAVTEGWDSNVSWTDRDSSNTWTTSGGTVDTTTALYVDAAGSYTTAGGWISPTGADILFVAGATTLTAKDQLVRDRLVAQGHSVTVVEDDFATASDATGRDLVLISSSVVPSKVGNTFKTVAVPVLTWEAWLFDDMEMTGTSGKRGETSSNQSQVVITDPNHAMAGGLSGTVTVATANSKFSWGKSLPAGAEQVATLATDSSKSVIFGYQKDDSMDGAYIAPAARVAMFMNFFTPSYMTAQGWELFDAAIVWALDPANNGNSPSAGSVLFVGGNASNPPPGDDPAITRITDLGYSVTLADDDTVTAADAVGHDLVVLSSTVVLSKIGNMFETTAVPLLTWEGWLFDDMELTASGGNGETSATQSQLVIQDPSHPIAAGLTGTVTVSGGASKFSYGQALASADEIATVAGASTQAGVFAYETGDLLDGGLSAPARRVGLFPSSSTPTEITNDGWAIFEAAINWASEISPAPPNAGNQVSFRLTPVVHDWLTGATVNNGIQIAPTGIGINIVRFRSTEYSDTSQWPALVIEHGPRQGFDGPFSFETRQLTDTTTVAVNVANGVGKIAATDLQIAGTGLDLTFGRFYTSTDLDRPWQFSLGADTYLQFAGDGTATYYAPDGEKFTYIADTTGGYFTPPGANADLVETSSTTWEIRSLDGSVTSKFTKAASTDPVRADLTSIFDRYGNTITLAYNGSGQLTSITDTQARIATLTWTSGDLTKITGPTGRTVTYAWTGDMLTSVTDTTGGVTTYTYDTQERLVEVTSPGGRKVTLSYTGTGRTVTSIGDVYDLSTGDAYTTSFAYTPGTPGSGTTTVTDALLNDVTLAYDALGRAMSITDPLGQVISGTWTPNNDTQTATDSGSNTTTLAYNANDTLDSVTDPDDTSPSTLITYADTNNPFLPTSVVGPDGFCTRTVYSANGDVTDSYSGLAPSGGNCDGQTGGVHTSTNYNTDGTTASETDANSNTTSYTYDTAGNLTAVDNPAPLADVTFTFDALSRIVTETDGNGNLTTFNYDAADRVTTISYAGDTACTDPANCVSLTYDDDGNIFTQVDGTGTLTNTYDDLGLLVSTQYPSSANACSGGTAILYSYDALGRQTSICDASGTITHSYNAVGDLTGVAEPGGTCVGTKSLCTTFTYDSARRRATRTYPTATPVVTTWSYDTESNTTRIFTSAGSTVLQDLNYTYDLGGVEKASIQTISDAVRNTVTTYSYDTTSQLTASEEKTGGVTTDTRSWIYDPVGNRTQTIVNGVTTTYTYNAADQLCWTVTGTSSNACASVPSGATTYTYDNNGNLTADSNGYAATYNAADQTVSTTLPGQTAAAATYLGTGQSTRTTYGADTELQNGQGTAGIVTGGLTTTWVRDDVGLPLVQDNSSVKSYYLQDQLGSTVALVSSTGAVTDAYTYSPFGIELTHSGTSSNPWRFAAGQADDPNRSIKFGDRYYDPTLGRWTQIDPAPTGDRYRYSYNNPINFIDRNGQLPGWAKWSLRVALVGPLGAAAWWWVTRCWSCTKRAALLAGILFSSCMTVAGQANLSPHYIAGAIVGCATLAAIRYYYAYNERLREIRRWRAMLARQWARRYQGQRGGFR